MCPHDILGCLYQWPGIFHYLFTGVPGKLDAYWKRNQDLALDVLLPGVDAGPIYPKVVPFESLVCVSDLDSEFSGARLIKGHPQIHSCTFVW